MESAVDEAFKRYIRLSVMLKRARTLSNSNPMDDRNIEMSLIEKGDRKADAVHKINAAFDDLGELLNNLAILDMCSSFEREFKSKLSTAIGEARKAVRDNYGIDTLFGVRERLVVQQGGIKTLNEIFLLLEGVIPDETSERLREVRNVRNAFAHGDGDLRTAGAVEVTAVRALLGELIARIS